MSYSEYANKKYKNYKELGWTLSEFWETEAGITFNSTDLSGTKRKHSFNDAGILVETGHFDAPSKPEVKAVPKVEVKDDPVPAVAEVLPEPVVVEPAAVEAVQEPKKTKKKKGQ